MPYIRTERGIRTQFKPTIIAQKLSDVFQSLYGQRVSRYRGEIQILTEEVIEFLNHTLGSDPTSEWTETQIIQAIEITLKNSSFDDVYAVFLEKHPKIKKSKNTRTKLAGFEPLELPIENDPIWSVQSHSSSRSVVSTDKNNIPLFKISIRNYPISLYGTRSNLNVSSHNKPL